MLNNQKIISTRKFLSTFSKLSKSDQKDIIYYLIVKNGEETGFYIPFEQMDNFLNISSNIKFYNKNLLEKKKNITLEDSYKKTKFNSNKNLSKNYKKILYS